MGFQEKDMIFLVIFGRYGGVTESAVFLQCAQSVTPFAFAVLFLLCMLIVYGQLWTIAGALLDVGLFCE